MNLFLLSDLDDFVSLAEEAKLPLPIQIINCGIYLCCLCWAALWLLLQTKKAQHHIRLKMIYEQM